MLTLKWVFYFLENIFKKQFLIKKKHVNIVSYDMDPILTHTMQHNLNVNTRFVVIPKRQKIIMSNLQSLLCLTRLLQSLAQIVHGPWTRGPFSSSDKPAKCQQSLVKSSQKYKHQNYLCFCFGLLMSIVNKDKPPFLPSFFKGNRFNAFKI